MNRTNSERTRRWFLSASGAALSAACGAAPNRSSSSNDSASSTGNGSSQSSAGGQGMGGAGGGQGAGGQGEGGGEPLVCTPSDDNILGPYYRPDAPFRDDLTDPNMVGVRVTVKGSVLDETCQPIAGALIDLWQADDDGGYDNDGNDDPAPNIFVLRGRLYSGSDGHFSFLTIVPGHYLNGAQYRPAHIHVTVSAPGFNPLTTQLYFKGDPYNDIDPFIKPSLIMAVNDLGSGKQATFDFVLAAN